MLPIFNNDIIIRMMEQERRALQQEAQLHPIMRLDAPTSSRAPRRKLCCRMLAALGKKLAAMGKELQERYGEGYPVQRAAR